MIKKDRMKRSKDNMRIKRQQGYCLKKIAGVPYLLPYGQKVADQKKGIVLNETGVFLWNELANEMTKEELANRLIAQYPDQKEAAEEIRKDVEQFAKELLQLGILQECIFSKCDAEGEKQAPKQPFVGCLQMADQKIALYGSKKLISSQFDAFLEKTNAVFRENDNEKYTRVYSKNEKRQDVSQKIELIQEMPQIHPNGNVLLRNKELVVCEWETSYVILFPSMKQILEAQMTADGRYVKVYIKKSVSDVEKENVREELFHAIRHFFLFFAQRQGFFALHSASILYRGKAWLFSGHSGMGKSTHTNLWKEQFGVKIINGDLNLIGWSKSSQNESEQNTNKHPIVYGMPWCGTSGIASTKVYPLGGIVLLGRSDRDHFESLAQDQKIVRVMQRMISPVWKQEMLEQNLKCAEQLAGQIPIYYLLCTKNPSAAQVMKARIDQEEMRR